MSGLIALIGPTAVGKTDVSIELAKRLEAEIVGCDSMQVYLRMSRLTTQPTREQRAAVPHHLIDCVEPTQTFSVGHYREQALAAIGDIQRRGKSALLVGGTGLYLRAIRRGLCEAPPEDPAVRARLEAHAREQGSVALHVRLRDVDAVAAEKIHPHDARRIVRALEVYEVTGQPLSRLWRWEQGEGMPMTVIALDRPRAQLHERINRRVVAMIEDEAVLDEAREALRLPLSRTAAQVHGLRYLEPYLRRETTKEHTIMMWQQQVRQYARRQLIWFRAEPQVRWVVIAGEEPVRTTVERILEQFDEAPTRRARQ